MHFSKILAKFLDEYDIHKVLTGGNGHKNLYWNGTNVP